MTEFLKSSVVPVPLGSFIDDVAKKERLIFCPYFKNVLWDFPNSLGFHKSWNMCSLDSEHCPYHGKRVRFKVNHVVWNCPKIVTLAGKDGVVHGF